MRNNRDLSLQHQDNVFDLLDIFILTWKNSPDPWGAKDNQSRFLYANDAYKTLLNIPLSFQIEGRLDSELPAATAEFAPQFQAHDRQVELQGINLTSLEVHPFGKEKAIQPYLFEKSPLYNLNHQCVGTIFHGRKLLFFSPEMLLLNQSPASFMFASPDNLFSEREWDVIFFLLQKKTSKEIAQLLNLTPRTVQSYIQGIYYTADVTNFNEFISFCKVTGYDKYIPSRFIKPYHILL